MVPKISAIMPVYNTDHEYLRQSINAILGQEFSDFEFIIVNDGSPDKMVSEIVKSYDDPRIRLIEMENNGGISVATNVGMRAATGEYIALCDHDDISLPIRFARQARFLDKHPDVSAVGGGIKVIPNNDDARITEQDKPEIKYLDMMRHMQVKNMLMMFRRKDALRFDMWFDEQDHSSAQDYDFWCRYIRFGKIANIQETLLLYRWHENNTSGTRDSQNRNRTKQVQENMLNWLTDDEQIRKEIRRSIAKRYWVGIPLIRIRENKKMLFGFIPVGTV